MSDDAGDFAALAPGAAAPQPAIASAAPAPVRAAPIAPAPLQGSDDELIARAALAEGDHTPDSWRAIGGVIRNRMAHSGKGAADVLSEPGQFESYGNGHIQGVDTNSPAYKAALAAVQGVKPGDVPYDSFYQPQIVAQRGVTPPFAATQGTRIGTQLFGTGGYGQAAPAGLTPDEKAAWDALQPKGPTTPEGNKPGVGTQFLNIAGKPMTAAQEKWYAARAASPQGLDTSGLGTDYSRAGTPGLPYALAPGYPLPSTPGAHYVDFDGVEHVVPGGLGAEVKNTVQGALQSLGSDQAAAADKLTGGGLGVPSAVPGFVPMGALAELHSPGFSEGTRQGALSGMEDQQRRYAFAHAGDEYAAAGRFGGSLIPGTLAAAAVPEIKLPGMAAEGGVGALSRLASRGLTNSARGVAATAPTVGTDSAPVPEQLAAGGMAGLLGPEAIEGGGKLASGLTGLGKSTTPEVAGLARTAADKYGIKLRAGQIEGATDRSAAYRDSQLASAPGSGVTTSNAAQHRAFSQALAGTIGEHDAPGLTPAVMENARQRIGSVFDDVAARTGFRADPQLASDLGRITTQARELGLDQSQINALDAQVQKIVDLTATHGDVIPGPAYQSITQKGSSLSRIMDSDHSAFGDLAHDVRGALDDAVARNSSPEDVAALQQARLQWKNLKTLQPLAAKASPEGFVSPALLRGRVSSQFDNFAYGGGSDLGELARIGQLMKEPPNSGTANRLGEMMKGGAFGAAGTGILMTALHGDPALAGQMGAGALGLAALRYGNNAVRGALNDNPLVRASLLRSGEEQGGVLGGLRTARNLARPTEVPLSALAAHALLYSPDEIVRRTAEPNRVAQ